MNAAPENSVTDSVIPAAAAAAATVATINYLPITVTDVTGNTVAVAVAALATSVTVYRCCYHGNCYFL